MCDMNPIQEFLLKAKLRGAEAELRKRLREADARALKAENEAAELRAALGNMQLLKEKYQTVVFDMMDVLERHGMVK